MCCQNYWKKLLPFALTLMLGLLAVYAAQKNITYGNQENSIGNGSGSVRVIVRNASLQVLSKPQANYTEAARINHIQGNVTLRVTFLASGEIGQISVVNPLSDDLTEQAINAARGIKFEPAKKDGVPYTVTKQVQYNFTLY